MDEIVHIPPEILEGKQIEKTRLKIALDKATHYFVLPEQQADQVRAALKVLETSKSHEQMVTATNALLTLLAGLKVAVPRQQFDGIQTNSQVPGRILGIAFRPIAAGVAMSFYFEKEETFLERFNTSSTCGLKLDDVFAMLATYGTRCVPGILTWARTKDELLGITKDLDLKVEMLRFVRSAEAAPIMMEGLALGKPRAQAIATNWFGDYPEFARLMGLLREPPAEPSRPRPPQPPTEEADEPEPESRPPLHPHQINELEALLPAQPGDSRLEQLLKRFEEHGRAVLRVQGAVLVRLPLTSALEQAFRAYRRASAPVVSHRQEVPIDLAIFRVIHAPRLLESEPPLAVFCELDDQLVQACPRHEPNLSEELRILGAKALRPWCRSRKEAEGATLHQDFRIDLETWRETVEDNHDEDPLDHAALATALQQLDTAFAEANALFFAGAPPLRVEIRDREHDHGFIRTPWTSLIGPDYAIVVVARGVWY